jgi:hypothetical protein
VPAWSTFGPHAIGAERFVAVSSGTSFAQVEGAILRKQSRVENPDKDEVPGSSPGRPTNQHHSSQRRHRAGAAVGIAALPLVPVASCWGWRPSHQQRQTAHGQQSHAQGDGQAAAEDPYSTLGPPFNHHGVRFLPGRDRSG